jgi:hypothetical protein
MVGAGVLVYGTLYDVPIDVGTTAKFTKICLAYNGTALFVRAD